MKNRIAALLGWPSEQGDAVLALPIRREKCCLIHCAHPHVVTTGPLLDPDLLALRSPSKPKRVRSIGNRQGRSIVQTHYDVLGVEPTANFDVIKHAWHVKALLLHPDRHEGASEEIRAEAAKETLLINGAWDILRDPTRRRSYDQSLEQLLGTANRPEARSTRSTPRAQTVDTAARTDTESSSGSGGRPGASQVEQMNSLAQEMRLSTQRMQRLIERMNSNAARMRATGERLHANNEKQRSMVQRANALTARGRRRQASKLLATEGPALTAEGNQVAFESEVLQTEAAALREEAKAQNIEIAALRDRRSRLQ